MVSAPGPSVSSQSVIEGIRLARPPRPCSTSRCGLVGLDDRRVHPDPPRPHRDAKPRPGADPGRLDPGQVEVGEEVVGEGRAQGEVGDRLEGTLARHVDLDLCADRAHRRRDSMPAAVSRPSSAGNPRCGTAKPQLGSTTEPPGRSQRSSASLGTSSDSLTVGTIPGAGTYFCASCGSQLSLRENDRLPECPRCGATEYQRDSIFEAMQDHGQTAEIALPGGRPRSRVAVDGPGDAARARPLPRPL